MPSPETLLSSRGASDTLYTVRDGSLVALTIRDGVSGMTGIAMPEGWTLIDHQSSPDGNRVAVLMQSGAGMALAFFDQSGDLIGEPYSLTRNPTGTPTPGASPAASPAATSMATPASPGDPDEFLITWSPDGSEVLVVGPSRLVRVPVEGEPEGIDINFDLDDGDVLQATWSPAGAHVLLRIKQEDQSTASYLLNLADRELREIKALQTTGDTRIESLSWLPDGSGVLFVRSTLAGDVPLQGQLFVYRLGQEVPNLVATSGQGGPSASITHVKPSPDGRAVAFVVSIRDGERWSFHSMWVRPLETSQSYQVPVDNVDSVSQIWWLGDGLAWEQRPHEADEPGEILFAREDIGPTVILNDEGEALPVATPVATPIASPGAIPAGTPHG